MAGEASPPGQADSTWVIAGNIVEERPYGPGGSEIRRGTRLFRPGAKVYLDSLERSYNVCRQYPYENVKVVGQHRKSRAWILSWVRAEWVANWRVQVLYQPGALERLRKAAWPGFALPRGAFEWPEEERSSPEAITALLDRLRPLASWGPNYYAPELSVTPYLPEWVRCPSCGVRFSIRNVPYSWVQNRHRTCGQRLRIAEPPDAATG